MAWTPSVCDIRKWERELDRVSDRIGLRFSRPEVRARARVYLSLTACTNALIELAEVGQTRASSRFGLTAEVVRPTAVRRLSSPHWKVHSSRECPGSLKLTRPRAQNN